MEPQPERIGRKLSLQSLQRLMHGAEGLDEEDCGDMSPGPVLRDAGLGSDYLATARSVADKFIINCLMDDTVRPFFTEAPSLVRVKVRQCEAILAAYRFGEVRETAPLSLAAHRGLSQEHMNRLQGLLDAAAREHVAQVTAGARGDGGAAADAFAERLTSAPGVLLGLLPASEAAAEAAAQASALARKGGAEAARKVLGVEYAPLSVPIRRRRQTLGSVLALSLLPASAVMLGAMLYCWRRTWPFLAAYLPWAMVFDRSPWQGGKAPWKSLRQAWIFRQFANYFPASLIKSNPQADFQGERPMLMGYHPHGILSFGAFCNFGTDTTGWAEKFPGLTPRLVTLNLNMKFPFMREIITRLGVIAASRGAIKAALRPGNAVIVVVGGAAEALDTKPGEYVLTLARRRGFFKLAIETGADLVPCFGFGENDIYGTITSPDSLLRKMQAKLYKALSFSTPLFYGRGIFTYNCGLLPFRRPLHTVVGDPIRVERDSAPPPEKVEALKARYIDALRRLYEEWQPRLEPGEHRPLIIV